MYTDKYDLQANCKLQQRRETCILFFTIAMATVKIKYIFHDSYRVRDVYLNIGYSVVLSNLSDGIIE